MVMDGLPVRLCVERMRVAPPPRLAIRPRGPAPRYTTPATVRCATRATMRREECPRLTSKGE